MVEKRQARGEGVSISAEEPASEVTREDARHEEALLDGLPGGLAPLPTIHDDLANELLEVAERQVAETRKKFGPQSSKPRLKHIEDLFNAKVGRAPRVGEEMERLMRAAAAVHQTAVLDGSFDRALAMALNVYDKSSVQGGANVQSAHDSWSMAVRIYKSELRAAGSVLAADIEAANHPVSPRDYTEYDEPARGAAQVQYYGKAAKIGQSLLTYEKTMQQAGTALATAYGQLTAELYSAVNALGVAEATLISATQTAYSIFWTGVQNAVAQTRS